MWGLCVLKGHVTKAKRNRVGLACLGGEKNRIISSSIHVDGLVVDLGFQVQVVAKLRKALRLPFSSCASAWMCVCVCVCNICEVDSDLTAFFLDTIIIIIIEQINKHTCMHACAI